MKLMHLLTASALVANMGIAQTLHAAEITKTQTLEIQKIIHEYLVNNPEVLIEASQSLQRKQQQDMQQQAQAIIIKNAGQLFSDKLTSIGNAKGDVTLVEFFDYQCIHCKKMAPVIHELITKNPHLKVVYKEFPIFGESSDTASKAALAAAMQGKYLAMHEALIKNEGRLNDQIINSAAESIGLNMAQFKTDMSSKTVTEALDANRALAEQLHLMGTPAFIIAATPAGQLKAGSVPAFIPGAATAEALASFIKKAKEA